MVPRDLAAHLLGMETAHTDRERLEPLMSIEELSEYLHVPVRTLYDWRLAGKGPCAVHVGRQIRYFVTDVHEWLAGSASRAGARARGAVRLVGRPRTPIGTFGDITYVKVREARFVRAPATATTTARSAVSRPPVPPTTRPSAT